MRILITGPCSSGKTTILTELKKKGYNTGLEHARDLWVKGLRGDKFELKLLEKRLEDYM